MTDEVKLRIETVIMNIASNVPNLPKERVQKVIENLCAMKDTKDVIEKLAMSLERIFGNSPQFKDVYRASLEQVLTIDANAFESVEELLKKVEFNKSHNVTPGNISIEENHTLINSTISSLCSKLNELGVDYYLVGALSAFIGTGVPLFRYHGDLDFMIAEKDIDKVREALKDSDYVFEDNRLTTDKTYDPKVGHTQGEHEVIANHKENEFHLGFFLFDRQRDGSINIKEYYKGRKDGKDVPMVLIRHLPKELVELEYTTESVEYSGTSFRTSTPESIYSKKVYTAKGKDLLDIQALEGKIDFAKIEEAKKIRTTTRTMCADDRSFNH